MKANYQHATAGEPRGYASTRCDHCRKEAEVSFCGGDYCQGCVPQAIYELNDEQRKVAYAAVWDMWPYRDMMQEFESAVFTLDMEEARR